MKDPGMKKLGICQINMIPVRTEAAETSEMCNQILFGETYSVISEKDRWLEIRTSFDNYPGWIDKKLFESYQDNRSQESKVTLCNQIIMPTTKLLDQSSIYAVAGSEFHDLSASSREFNIGKFTFQINEKIENLKFSDDSFDNIIDSYQNTPYLWGGRSPFGIDCSGFSQVVFKLFSISLPRDASQQIECGELISDRKKAKLGDLSFFENEKGRITHVGILKNANSIIHTSGYVRIDEFSDEGIIHSETKVLTHKLNSIKRVLNL